MTLSSIEKLFADFADITGRKLSDRKKLLTKIRKALDDYQDVMPAEDHKAYSELEAEYTHLSGILDLNPDHYKTEEEEEVEVEPEPVKPVKIKPPSDGVKHFPYSAFRENQREGIQRIMDCAKKGVPLILDSPTGTGKSVMVLSGLLNLTGPEDRIVVLTRTHSQYDAFIKEVRLMQESGSNLSCGILAGRESLCPVGISNRLCSKAKYHSKKSMKNGFSRQADRKTSFSAARTMKMGDVGKGCPFFTNTFDYLLGEHGHFQSPTIKVQNLIGKHRRRPFLLEEF
ncbi:DEAD/DEAH box helicase family protein, partial [Candidatus Altiarchaeota archaeon]